jgi:hypothetical protein
MFSLMNNQHLISPSPLEDVQTVIVVALIDCIAQVDLCRVITCGADRLSLHILESPEVLVRHGSSNGTPRQQQFRRSKQHHDWFFKSIKLMRHV